MPATSPTTHPLNSHPLRATHRPAQHPLKLVVCGFTGYHNLGDELLVAALIQQLAHLQTSLSLPLHVTVLTHTPTETQQWLQPYKADLTLHTAPRFSIPHLLKVLYSADGLIVGGGGLFQDATGLGSPIYYGGLMALARILGCKVACWGHGIGPLNRPLSQWLTQKALQLCSVIGVRDNNSAHWVRQHVEKSPHLSSDAVWGLTATHAGMAIQSQGKTALGLSLRPSTSWPQATQTALIETLIQHLEAHHSFPSQLYLLNAHPDLDTEPLQHAADLFKAHRPDITVDSVEWANIPAALGQCQQVVAMRYHVVMAAALSGCATAGIVYDPKVADLCHSIGLPTLMPNKPNPEPHAWLGICAQPLALERQKARAKGNQDVLAGFITQCGRTPN